MVQGNTFLLEYGLCVLQALVDIKKKGLCGSALINNRRYWLRYTNGEKVKLNLTKNDVGYIYALCNELENVLFVPLL